MSKTTLLTVAVTGLLLLNAGMLVFMFTKRPPEGPPRGERRGGAADFIIQQLKLDDQQQQQFAELRKQHQQQTREAQEENRHLHETYFALLKQSTPGKNQVDSLAGLIGIQHKKIELAAFSHFQQLRSICNEEQQKRFDTTIEEIIRRMLPPPDEGRREGRPPG